MLVRRQPTIGLPHLRRLIADLPKNATARYLHRVKKLLARRRRRNWRRLHWHVPNAVWAIDGTWLDRPVPGLGRRALIVVELNRRRTIAFQAVRGERAADVRALLLRLIDLHGRPLVLKADNGSAFIARSVAELCRSRGITLMHSPVRRPRWNGTCEVSGRWAKRRAEAAASPRGGGALSQLDLDAAVSITELMPAVDENLRQAFLAAYTAQLALVASERGLANAASLPDHLARSLGRVAAQRALQLCHILSIEGRAYRQRLPCSAA